MTSVLIDCLTWSAAWSVLDCGCGAVRRRDELPSAASTLVPAVAVQRGCHLRGRRILVDGIRAEFVLSQTADLRSNPSRQHDASAGRPPRRGHRR
jgi:hypothetical protein